MFFGSFILNIINFTVSRIELVAEKSRGAKQQSVRAGRETDQGREGACQETRRVRQTAEGPQGERCTERGPGKPLI